MLVKLMLNFGERLLRSRQRGTVGKNRWASRRFTSRICFPAVSYCWNFVASWRVAILGSRLWEIEFFRDVWRMLCTETRRRLNFSKIEALAFSFSSTRLKNRIFKIPWCSGTAYSVISMLQRNG